MKSLLFSIGVALALVPAYCGNVIWVDSRAGSDGEGRGSEKAPFATIQAAVDAAQSGDTVKVRPGVYDQGGARTVEGKLNRVKIVGKKLVVESTGGKDFTHVVGGHDPESAYEGMGLGGARCFYLENAIGSVIKGFTIRDGSSNRYNVNSDYVQDSGGGVISLKDGSAPYLDTNAYVVDCVISNCVGVRAAALRGCTAVRCYITGNYGEKSGAAGRNSSFLNCLITRNRGDSFIYEGTPKVFNCTVVNNHSRMYGADVRNSVVAGNLYNGTAAGHTACIFAYSVTDVGEDAAKFDAASRLSTCAVGAPYFQFVAPMYEDFRVLEGSETETAGNAGELAELQLPDGIDRNFDLEGNPIAGSGTIMAGCIQRSVAPEGGAIYFRQGDVINAGGRPVYGANNYAFAESWPTQFHVQAKAKGTVPVRDFKLNGTTVYPTIDDTLWIVPPESYSQVITGEVSDTRGYITVDPKAPGATDDRAGVGGDVPYKTIHAALESAGHYWVIKVNPGIYGEEEGVFETSYGKTRVVVDKQLRLVGSGADRTVILGAAPTPGADAFDGVRCVAFEQMYAAIQGFTLSGGHTDMANPAADTIASRGGGVTTSSGWTESQRQTVRVLDCVITNCTAVRGGGVYGTTCERTLITDCYGEKSQNRYARFFSCVFDSPSRDIDGGQGSLTYHGTLVNCTLVGRNADSYVFNRQSGNLLTNTIVHTTKEFMIDSGAAGSIVWNAGAFSSSAVQEKDPGLADVSARDYRPVAGSPALGLGEIVRNLDVCWVDFCGRPMNFAGSRPAAGAYQWPVAGVCISVPAKGSVSPSGFRPLDDDGSITVSFADAADRHISGAIVDGEKVLLGRGESSLTLVFDAGDASKAHTIVPIVSTDWYVNANTDPAGGKIVGDDGNSGFTPWEPKLTLAGMFSSGLVLPGDTVHAAEGVYGNEEDETYLSRVTLAPGTTLVGDDGPEKTFIVGRHGAGESITDKLAEGNLRCVWMRDNTRLVGFTLTGGGTDESASDNDWNMRYYGGALGCSGGTTIENCIISNNFSSLATCYGGKYVGCKIVDNAVKFRASAAFSAELVSSFVDRNEGNNALQNMVGLCNCTLGGGNTKNGQPYIALYNHGETLVNCAFVGWVYGSDVMKAYNCRFLKGNLPGSWVTMENCEVYDSVEEFGLDGQYRPLSPASPLVDSCAGDYARGGDDFAFDAAGGQRTYNALMDIGCYEYDWREIYSGKLGVEVVSASAGVKALESALSIPDGALVVVDWPNGYGKKMRSSFAVDVPPATRLDLAIEGEAVERHSFGPGETAFSYLCGEGGDTLSFACAGEGAAEISGFVRGRGMVIFVK